jgi:putative endonuclease
MYTVYILYSAELDRYYIGFIGDFIAVRLKKHLTNHKGFTGKKADWKVVYTKEYIEKKDAILMEKKIKSWKSRIMIKKLIQSTE